MPVQHRDDSVVFSFSDVEARRKCCIMRWVWDCLKFMNVGLELSDACSESFEVLGTIRCIGCVPLVIIHPQVMLRSFGNHRGEADEVVMNVLPLGAGHEV